MTRSPRCWATRARPSNSYGRYDKWGETPLAAVILREGATATAGALRDWINERVAARYQRVSEVVIMKTFPRSAAGKTLKREMREPYWTAPEKKI